MFRPRRLVRFAHRDRRERGMLVIVVFFVVHILMVIAAGPINEMRSMITGWYRGDPEAV
jgi:thiosulfate reductase cytochrome b subunit